MTLDVSSSQDDVKMNVTDDIKKRQPQQQQQQLAVLSAFSSTRTVCDVNDPMAISLPTKSVGNTAESPATQLLLPPLLPERGAKSSGSTELWVVANDDSVVEGAGLLRSGLEVLLSLNVYQRHCGTAHTYRDGKDGTNHLTCHCCLRAARE
jgi:hypothetical protein